MQRDHKIGLALGILLVGAVAAFFFRHEETPGVLPPLRTAAELDQRIAERTRSPYLHPSEVNDPADQLQSADPWDRAPGGLVPDPIPIENDPDPMAPTLAAEPARSPASGGYHVVQRGETLSSIAAKYLGSAARYQELYQINADRLRDANDLRVGMELRVPTVTAAGVPPARTATLDDRRVQRDRGTADREPPDESLRGVESLPNASDVPVRFEPYRRSPLTPQGTEPQSSTLDPKDAARRRLTQLPPRGDVSPPR